MIQSLSVYTTTLIFWISLIGVVVLGVHPKIRDYVVPGEKIMSFWQAGTVMFTGLYSSSALYWSFFENVLFKDDPNFIALFPDKVGNPYFLTAMTLYNWVAPLYTTLFIATTICIFVVKYKDMYLAPKYKNMLTIIFVMLAIFSTTRILTSLGSYIIPLKFILNLFSGINNSFLIVIALLLTCFWSASGGLQHIKKLANICSFLIILYTIIFMVKLFFLNDGANYIYRGLQEFVELMVNTNFIKAQFQFNNAFVKDWTVLFSTVHIISTFPALYFFYITMQGRPVKELILLYNVSIVLPTLIIFSVNSSLVQILAKINNFPLNADNYFDMYQIMFDYINLGQLSAIILFLAMFTLIVTSVDSIIYACAKYLKIQVFDDGKIHKHSGGYIYFTIGFLILLGSFLMYVLSFKSTPALAVRLYEFNYVGSISVFLPLLYMTYKVIRSFHDKKTNNNKNTL